MTGNDPYCHRDILLFDTNIYWFVPDWNYLNPIQMYDTNQVVMTFDPTQHTPNYLANEYVNIQGGRVDTAVALYVLIRSGAWLPTQNEIKNKESSLSLYPNPSSDNLYLSVSNNTAETIKKIEIYTIAGIKYAEFTALNQQFQIDVSKYPNGMYLLKSNAEQGILTKRFVVQH